MPWLVTMLGPTASIVLTSSNLSSSRLRRSSSLIITLMTTRASWQIRKIVGCACAGNVGNVFPATDPDVHHGTCMTHLPWCMPGSLTSGFLWSRWRGKRSRHSRRMRNPQFYESGRRPMTSFKVVAKMFWNFAALGMLINQFLKSHNAPVPYPTMHRFGTEMSTFLFQSGVLWGVGLVNCVIY